VAAFLPLVLQILVVVEVEVQKEAQDL